MLESQTRDLIKYVLNIVGKYSKSREDLIFGTISQESLRGKYKRQIGYDIDSKGGAFGICQIELATAKFIRDYCIRKNGFLSDNFFKFRNVNIDLELDIMSSDLLSIYMCFVYYWTKPESIPTREEFETEDDYILALGKYWKKYWNSELGAGTPEEFARNYKR